MPMGTRRSSRRIAGGTESEGDQSDSSVGQSSPRKRVSRSAKKTTKSKISEEKIKSIPEESLKFDITDASTPVKNKHNVSLDKNKKGSNTPQPLDISSVASESVKSVDCSSDSKEKSAEKTATTEVAHSKKRSAKETTSTTTEAVHSRKRSAEETTTTEAIHSKKRSAEETTTTEAIHSKEKSAEEIIAPCDVMIIKNVMEAFKQESTTKKKSKGMAKSGRPWKTEQTARFSGMKKDKPLRSSWQLKMAQKAEKMSVRKYQQGLEDAKRQAKLLKKQRREEHDKKKEENQRKSEVVQVIKNPAKLKRMKKKQLRMIQKRPTVK